MNELARRRAPVVAHDTTTRTVTARLVTWNDPHDVVDPDGARYRETWAPGALVPRDRVYVVDEHGGDLIGRAVNHRDDGTGHLADLEIADTTAGRDLMALVDAGIVESVSIEFPVNGGTAQWSPARDAVTRTSAPLYGVAFAFTPAHTAPVLAVREEPSVTDVLMPDTPMPVTTSVHPLDLDELVAVRGEMVAMREELARRAETTPANPLYQFNSFGEMIWRAADIDHNGANREPLLFRALADQVQSNNPGVIPPAWINDVKGIVSFGRPGISAVGARPLPETGDPLTWPYFDGNLLALITAQATQKTAITSVRVDIKKGTSNIATYAGGSDISYQLIRRSGPSYLETYMRIMSAAWAACTDSSFVGQLVTGSTKVVGLDPATATTAQIGSAIFEASMDVFNATGQPASAVIADPVWFKKLGALLFPSEYGTFNVVGTAQASTLSVSLSGLPVAYDPYVPTGNMIVTNNLAAGWYEDGPMVAVHEDTEKLGHDVAVWGMGTPALFVPAGVVLIHA